MDISQIISERNKFCDQLRKEREASQRLVEKYRRSKEDMDWIIQTVHRAHHETDLESCRQGICASKTDMLDRCENALREYGGQP